MLRFNLRTVNPILQKILLGESQTLEFKFELNSARRISATLSAFSNTDGGTLLIGVKDNGHVAGVRAEEELYVLEAAADLYCKPKVPTEIRRWEIDGKVVLEVVIAPSADRPVKAESVEGEWRAWVRYGASNRLASPVHLELWKMQHGKEKPSVYSTKEQKLLEALQQKSWLSLNQAARITKIPRQAIIRTMASFVRWELAEMLVDESGNFVFSLREDV